jgi:hypothetical protein
MKTENPSACVSVNCNVLEISDSAVIACSSESCVNGVNISNPKPRLVTPTRDNITCLIFISKL